jgi:hypothetical protein
MILAWSQGIKQGETKKCEHAIMQACRRTELYTDGKGALNGVPGLPRGKADRTRVRKGEMWIDGWAPAFNRLLRKIDSRGMG